MKLETFIQEMEKSKHKGEFAEVDFERRAINSLQSKKDILNFVNSYYDFIKYRLSHVSKKGKEELAKGRDIEEYTTYMIKDKLYYTLGKFTNAKTYTPWYAVLDKKFTSDHQKN